MRHIRTVGADDWYEEEEERNAAPLFWWKGNMKALCFDLRLTPSRMLADGAPELGQWWDVEKLSESDSFVGVSKPAGMFVVTDGKGLWEASPTNFIHVVHRRVDIPNMREDGESERGICHRLDSHTSGIQIIGKSPDACRYFWTQNSSHKVQKEYLALVHGRLGGPDGPNTGVVDLPMKKWQDFGRREFGSVICAKEGMPAVTKYKALRQFKVKAEGNLKFWGEDRWFTLVQLRILTGRTHQIRVHMCYMGHPLVGDIKYNWKNFEQDSALVPRIFLHCTRMEFEDMNGEMFLAASDLAADLQAVLLRLQTLSTEAKTREPLRHITPFPGLTKILEASVDAVPCANCDFSDLQNRRIVQRCANCGCEEESTCIVERRGANTALFWSLSVMDTLESDRPSHASACDEEAEASWGPSLLWLPTELKLTKAGHEPDAPLEELGEAWGLHGNIWTWAHDGTRANGWIHLHQGGSLSTKWGKGTWRLFHFREQLSSPLLLLIFNRMEHALRLTLGADGNQTIFEILAKRKAQIDGCIVEEHCLEPSSRPCCATIGWPESSAKVDSIDSMPRR